ncbi:Cysteine desulfurase IscS [Sulfitobacter indolifex]|uniref:Cysteine desulfurase n=1 Tax=Sulfitobacter indolifex HEL-45 TaxID=391624 RepID=A0ABP2D8M8_9RHOB|nr:cysteine desulfurase family protein [Sulfitobacter indolifex]EDQ04588.1 aminotransferase, class V [Sulfitobacter indolifex HEL-45]UOA18681.1 Cysteine desulfurase IscS [Sulfitobacter indolifex]
MRTYLDHNATTPLRPEARAAMIAAMDLPGNPSSVHAEGRAAKAVVERARAQVAGLVGCDPVDVIFTSGATEAAALAASLGARIVTSAVEHDAVLSWGQADRLGVDAQGIWDGDLSPAEGADLVALQAANSETGVLQQTMSLAQQCWAMEKTPFVLVDAVQALGKTSFKMATSGADFILVSAHKLGGPKGVGALIVKRGIDVAAQLRGGGQEMGRRSGTENIPGIAGFGAAAEAAAADVAAGRWKEVAELRDLLEATLADASKLTIFVGKGAPRLPNTSCIVTPGWKGETQVMQMDLAGFAISAGSACSSGKVRGSAVLRAMGFDETQAASAIRVSLGLQTTREDILRFATSWTAKMKKHETRAA